ncbi:MAG: oxalate/formate MFS antiporter [Candidatus Acidiferrales bacterium]
MSSVIPVDGSSESRSGANQLPVPASPRFWTNPWTQLAAGVICMAMVANLQYGWTIFVNPIDAKFHWGKVAIQYTFTLFVLFETWLVPLEAYLADRYGPRIVVMAGGVLIAAAWIIYAKAATLLMLYIGGAIGGIGTGLVYGTCVGNAVKWFQDRRGLAAGLTAAGFGAGAAITVVPLTRSLASHGYQTTLFHFALLQGIVVLLAAIVLVKPPKGPALRRPNPRLVQSKMDFGPGQMLRSPIFWIMYVAFILVGSSGLMAAAQLAPIANGFKIAQSSVTLFGFTGPALVFALSLNNLMNGVGRPIFGSLSDYIGREVTMFITFVGGALAMLGLSKYGQNPALFVILAALIFLSWGDIYSIFPALTSDQFGRKFASTNYGFLYTAKGCAALFVPIGGYVAARTGSWTATLEIAAAANVVSAVLMVFVVRPLRIRESRRREGSATVAAAPAD